MQIKPSAYSAQTRPSRWNTTGPCSAWYDPSGYRESLTYRHFCVASADALALRGRRCAATNMMGCSSRVLRCMQQAAAWFACFQRGRPPGQPGSVTSGSELARGEGGSAGQGRLAGGQPGCQLSVSCSSCKSCPKRLSMFPCPGCCMCPCRVARHMTVTGVQVSGYAFRTLQMDDSLTSTHRLW